MSLVSSRAYTSASLCTLLLLLQSASMDQAGKPSMAHDGERIINKHLASPPPAHRPMAITETMSPNKKTLNFHAGDLQAQCTHACVCSTRCPSLVTHLVLQAHACVHRSAFQPLAGQMASAQQQSICLACVCLRACVLMQMMICYACVQQSSSSRPA